MAKKLDRKDKLILEVDLDESATVQEKDKRKYVAAAAAAIGTYVIIRGIQRGLGQIGAFFQAAFNPGISTEAEPILAADPFAIGMGLSVGAMILADIDPTTLIEALKPI